MRNRTVEDVKSWRLAADQAKGGNPDAIFLVEDVKSWRLAADQGQADAQYNLGLAYDVGEGVPQDYVEAVKWYRKAAAQGDASAQNNLGDTYYAGEGVLQDYVEAHKWYNLSAAAGNTIAGELRDLIAKKMTPEQIAEAQRLAREWKPLK